MNSRGLTLLCAALGVALFAWLLTKVELQAVAQQIARVGLIGFAIILAIYFVEFLCDVWAWQLTISGTPVTVQWTRRLFMVRTAGEAYNVITPLGGMGGEPVKALILRERYGVPYSAAGASLVLAKTMNVIALVLFLGVGFLMILDDARINDELQLLASSGLVGLSLGIAGFCLVQRFKLASRIGARINTDHPRLAGLLAGIAEFDQHLIDFYTTSPARFMIVLALGVINWIIGAASVWFTMYLMGSTISFADAWIIEAMAQMVRASTFFIPASLGAQEGAIMLFTGAITGQADSGLALALVRRARELSWVVAGLALSTRLLRKP